MTVLAKSFLASHFGSAPRHSYIAGCSGGGREASGAARRYPADFDGVIIGNPGFAKVSQFLSVAAALQAIDTLRAASGVADVRDVFSDSDLALVTNAAIAQCDPLDGLTDGVVANPRACNFSPRTTLQCSGAKTDTCLTSDQLTAIETIYAGASTSAAAAIPFSYPGVLPGLEAGWRRDLIGSNASPAGLRGAVFPTLPTFGLMDSAYKDYFESGTTWFTTFNIDRDVRFLSRGMEAQNNDRPEYYDAFKARGGKAIMYSGITDAAVQIKGLWRFMDNMAAYHGPETSNFFRHFDVPGMGHCGGAFAAGRKGFDDFDPLTALENWVERGVAPELIVASGKAAPALGTTLPLCPYPQYARYNGAPADPNVAASYTCATNP